MVIIMWKEIFIMLLGVYLIRCLTDVYMIKTYNSILKLFKNNEYKEAKEKAIKNYKIYNHFSIGPFNKGIYKMHDNICYMIASVYYIENNERQFLYYLEKIKKEKEFGTHYFIRSLYFYSYNNHKLANHNYMLYLGSDKLDQDYINILKHIVEDNDVENVSLENINNYAILQLIDKIKTMK